MNTHTHTHAHTHTQARDEKRQADRSGSAILDGYTSRVDQDRELLVIIISCVIIISNVKNNRHSRWVYTHHTRTHTHSLTHTHTSSRAT